MPASRAPRKRVPSDTPAAPSARAAAMPRPSMIPPVATTGTASPTASTTCGTRRDDADLGHGPDVLAGSERAAMPAGLAALRDHAVGTGRHGAAGVGDRCDHRQQGTPAARAIGTAGVGSSNVVTTDAPASTPACSNSMGVPTGGGRAARAAGRARRGTGRARPRCACGRPSARRRRRDLDVTPTGAPPRGRGRRASPSTVARRWRS